MRVRLLELQNAGDSLSACATIGGERRQDLRGWAALSPLEPRLLSELRQEGLLILRGSAAALAQGDLGRLRGAGKAIAERVGPLPARQLAEELAARAGAIDVAASGLGDGSSGSLAWKFSRSRLAAGRTLVMGVVNVTPDSFSDGGRFLDPTAAIEHGLRLAAEGADILDVGGESTNPFVSKPVAASEERARVEPVVRELARRAGIPISIDTTKSDVAAAALEAGAEIVNDVSGLARDPALGKVVAAAGAALCLMHMRGTPQDMTSRARYADLLGEVAAELDEALFRARAAGVPEDRIALDPGLGFAKEAAHNLLLLRRLRELLQFGRPIIVGASRKSFLGKLTGKPPPERLLGSVAAAVIAAQNGAAIVRVHDVAATREALAISDAVRVAASSSS